MENKPEGGQPQNPVPGEGTPKTPDQVTISQKEFDDLKHKAEVSSQNFERAKKAEGRAKELEEENALLLSSTNTVPSEDNDRVKELENEVSQIKTDLTKSKVLETYPMLKDKWEDLESFRQLPENKGMNLYTAAKAFLIEKGLLDAPRKGLEDPSGGPRTPVKTSMSAEEVKALRESNYKEYIRMLNNGEIKIS